MEPELVALPAVVVDACDLGVTATAIAFESVVLDKDVPGVR